MFVDCHELINDFYWVDIRRCTKDCKHHKCIENYLFFQFPDHVTLHACLRCTFLIQGMVRIKMPAIK